MLADIVISVQGIMTQCIVETLRVAVQSGNIGGLRVEIVPGTFNVFCVTRGGSRRGRRSNIRSRPVVG